MSYKTGMQTARSNNHRLTTLSARFINPSHFERLLTLEIDFRQRQVNTLEVLYRSTRRQVRTLSVNVSHSVTAYVEYPVLKKSGFKVKLTGKRRVSCEKTTIYRHKSILASAGRLKLFAVYFQQYGFLSVAQSPKNMNHSVKNLSILFDLTSCYEKLTLLESKF